MKIEAWDGKKITKAGCYKGIPMDVYHSGDLCDGPSISSSGLRKIFNESPAHYFDQSPYNPNGVEQDEEKEAFILGRAAHNLLLGEPHFAREFVIRPSELPHYKTGVLRPWHGNNTECKEWVATQTKSILTTDMVGIIEGMARSLGSHPFVQRGMLNGKIEHSLVWRDKKTGVWLLARPDVIPTDDADFCDLKTTPSVQWLNLVRTLESFAYHQQAALVRAGCREVLDLEMSTFTLLFVEKKRPWCVRDVRLKDSDMDRGEQQNRAALRTFAECLNSKEWPGPGAGAEGTEFLELSGRAQERIDLALGKAVTK